MKRFVGFALSVLDYSVGYTAYGAIALLGLSLMAVSFVAERVGEFA